jgi:HSP20 family protein
MRRFYEDLLRQMELEARRSEDVLRRFLHAASAERFWEPAVDVYETGEALHVKIELPGVCGEELQVELAGDGRHVLIRGVRRDTAAEREQRMTFHQMEIYFGPFERVITLPPQPEVDLEQVQASYRDGFLLVTLPKKPPTPRTTNVPVTS